MDKTEATLHVTLNENKQCIKVYGDGSSTITFEADASQLANVLRCLAGFQGEVLIMELKKS